MDSPLVGRPRQKEKVMRRYEPAEHRCPHCDIELTGVSCVEFQVEANINTIMADTPEPWEGAWSVCEGCTGLMCFINRKWTKATEAELNAENRTIRREVKHIQMCIVTARHLIQRFRAMRN